MMALNISAGTLGALKRSLTARKPAVFSTAGALKRYSGASSHHSCAVETDTSQASDAMVGLGGGPDGIFRKHWQLLPPSCRALASSAGARIVLVQIARWDICPAI